MGTKSNQKFSYDKIKIRLQVRFIVSKEKQCLWIYADNFELIVVEAQKHQHRNYWKIIYNVYYLYYLCIIRGIVNHKGPTNSKLIDQHSKACITLVRLPTQAFPPSNFPTEAFLIVQLPPINSHQSVQSISAPGISRLIHVDSTKSFPEHRSREIDSWFLLSPSSTNSTKCTWTRGRSPWCRRNTLRTACSCSCKDCNSSRQAKYYLKLC